MKKIFNIVILVLWMVFIFMMSNAKAVESDTHSGVIVNIISSVVSIVNIDMLTVIVRKCAHMFEYFILGILMLNCLKDYNIKNVLIISIMFCILYSCSDEIHQLFIEGRSGEVIDIFIDSIGIILGSLFYKKICRRV